MGAQGWVGQGYPVRRARLRDGLNASVSILTLRNTVSSSRPGRDDRLTPDTADGTPPGLASRSVGCLQCSSIGFRDQPPPGLWRSPPITAEPWPPLRRDVGLELAATARAELFRPLGDELTHRAAPALDAILWTLAADALRPAPGFDFTAAGTDPNLDFRAEYGGWFVGRCFRHGLSPS